MSLEPLSDSQVPHPAPRARIDLAAHRRPPRSAHLLRLPDAVRARGDVLAVGFNQQDPDGSLNVAYVVALSLVDTVLLIGLILFFLRTHGESPREVFLGRTADRRGSACRPAARHLPRWRSAFRRSCSSSASRRGCAPIERNPLQDLIATPRDAAVFAVVRRGRRRHPRRDSARLPAPAFRAVARRARGRRSWSRASAFGAGHRHPGRRRRRSPRRCSARSGRSSTCAGARSSPRSSATPASICCSSASSSSRDGRPVA